MRERIMINRRILTLCLLALIAVPVAWSAQTQPRPAKAPDPPTSTLPITNKDVASTQRQLIELLRLSPTLTTVVSHDPSLLADQAYVSRNNPQLADFLAAHPEVGRTPDFYLFTHMNPQDGGPDEALERAVWPEVHRMRQPEGAFQEMAHDSMPMLAFACFLVALLWSIRLFLENR